MTDSQGKQANDSQAPETIHIKIPERAFEGMCDMMSKSRRPNMAELGCCEMAAGTCCPQFEDKRAFEFTIVMTRKE